MSPCQINFLPERRCDHKKRKNLLQNPPQIRTNHNSKSQHNISYQGLRKSLPEHSPHPSSKSMTQDNQIQSTMAESMSNTTPKHCRRSRRQGYGTYLPACVLVPVILLLCVLPLPSEAWVVPSPSSSASLSSSSASTSSAQPARTRTTTALTTTLERSHDISMYANDYANHGVVSTKNLFKKSGGTTLDGQGIRLTVPNSLRQQQKTATKKATSSQSLNRDGMPWKNPECVYMPIWEWQWSFFERHLTNFKATDHHYIESDGGRKKCRMVTWFASSDEYRHIRMTYLDGGNQTQIFTAVCYPRANLPIFGFDMLQFSTPGGTKKNNLAIVDFQPIHDDESDHQLTYEHLLKPIRDGAPSFQQEMSSRFFDPSRYFSKQTLLGRFQLEKPGSDDVDDTTSNDSQHDLLFDELLPAYQAYAKTHVDLIKQVQAEEREDAFLSWRSNGRLSQEDILQRHIDYENYVSEHDPAHPMFSSMFGEERAEELLYGVFFPLADKKQ